MPLSVIPSLLWLAGVTPCRAQDTPPAGADTLRPALPASTAARDTVAIPVAADTLTGLSALRPLGVTDTVTTLPPVRVEGQRSLTPDRTTATRVRLDRAEVTRFLPGTSTDALLAVPGVDLVKTGPWASRISWS